MRDETQLHQKANSAVPRSNYKLTQINGYRYIPVYIKQKSEAAKTVLNTGANALPTPRKKRKKREKKNKNTPRALGRGWTAAEKARAL